MRSKLLYQQGILYIGIIDIAKLAWVWHVSRWSSLLNEDSMGRALVEIHPRTRLSIFNIFQGAICCTWVIFLFKYQHYSHAVSLLASSMSCFLCPVAHFILTRMEDYLRTILETKRLAIFERWTLDHVYSLSYRGNNEQVSLPYPLLSETLKSTSHARDNVLYTCPPSTRNNAPVTIFRICTPLGVFCACCTIELWREYKDTKKSHVGHLQHEIVWFPETKRPAPLKLQCEVTPNFAHQPEGNNNRKQTITRIKRRQHSR